MNSPADIQLVVSLAASPGASGYKMHNAGYKALGLDYLYLPRRYAGEIEPALAAVRALGLRGVSLTMPFKLACIPYLDALSPAAAEIGAVNTVVNDGGKLTGHNTDAPAAKKLIEAHLPWKEKPWVILGTGGMAHALAYVAKELGVQAYVSARNPEKAKTLAQKFKLQTLQWGSDMAGKIVCNATPVGMAGQGGSPIAETAVASLAGVFDAVANPDAALTKAARASSLPVVSGDMLALEQACLQFELYTGKPAPREAMREALYG